MDEGGAHIDVPFRILPFEIIIKSTFRIVATIVAVLTVTVSAVTVTMLMQR